MTVTHAKSLTLHFVTQSVRCLCHTRTRQEPEQHNVLMDRLVCLVHKWMQIYASLKMGYTLGLFVCNEITDATFAVLHFCTIYIYKKDPSKGLKALAL